MFGDRGLAAEVRALEQRGRDGEPGEVLDEIVAAIGACYDLAGEEGPTATSPGRN